MAIPPQRVGRTSPASGARSPVGRREGQPCARRQTACPGRRPPGRWTAAAPAVVAWKQKICQSSMAATASGSAAVGLAPHPGISQSGAAFAGLQQADAKLPPSTSRTEPRPPPASPRHRPAPVARHAAGRRGAHQAREAQHPGRRNPSPSGGRRHPLQVQPPLRARPVCSTSTPRRRRWVRAARSAPSRPPCQASRHQARGDQRGEQFDQREPPRAGAAFDATPAARGRAGCEVREPGSAHGSPPPTAGRQPRQHMAAVQHLGIDTAEVRIGRGRHPTGRRRFGLACSQLKRFSPTRRHLAQQRTRTSSFSAHRRASAVGLALGGWSA